MDLTLHRASLKGGKLEQLNSFFCWERRNTGDRNGTQTRYFLSASTETLKISYIRSSRTGDLYGSTKRKLSGHLLIKISISNPGRIDCICDSASMAEQTVRSIIDSHIHLWPESMSNEDGHSWMNPGMPLAKQHVLADYYKAAESQSSESGPKVHVEGVVYVETDVRYESPGSAEAIRSWAQGPLNEILFVKAIVDGEYGQRDSEMLTGIVLWCPIDQPTNVLEEWLRLAEEIAGPETWKHVKGFRFLLQAILEQDKFDALISSDYFITNLRLLGKRGYSFDVGVDQHTGGIWQLESMLLAMTKAHDGVLEDEKVVFILNHLCKPDFIPDGPYFARWSQTIKAMSEVSKTYMKLSGAFSELPEGLNDAGAIATHMRPWVEHVLTCFGPNRVMFGSDWPVCNVRGPKGEDSWAVWKDVVGLIVDHNNLRLNDDHKESVWKNTAKEAYRLG